MFFQHSIIQIMMIFINLFKKNINVKIFLVWMRFKKTILVGQYNNLEEERKGGAVQAE